MKNAGGNLEKNWLKMFDSMDEMVAIISNDYRIIQANQVMREKFGDDAIKSKHCYELFHGTTHPPAGCSSCQTFKTGVKSYGERQEPHLDNAWLAVTTYPLDTINQEEKCIIHVVRDITERKRTEAALRESEKKYRILYESSRDAIMTLVPPNWKFTSCNPETVTMFKVRDEAEFVSLGPWELSPANQPNGRESSVMAREMIETAMAAGTNFFEWMHMRRDGEEFPASVKLSKVTIAGKEFLQATVRDISEVKRLEHQLLQSQKMESIGKLAGGIAHDFNNLLTVIRGNAQLLRCDDATDPGRAGRHAEDIDAIIAAANQAAKLTGQLLAFGRKQIFKMTATDMNAFIHNQAGMLRQLIGEHIGITVESSPDPLPMHIDVNQFELVLINLATNSRDAMPQGGEITITTRRLAITPAETDQLTPGEYAHIEFADTGPGIDPKIKSRIFEPYFSTKEFGKQSGLGLSTVYGIIKQHNGYIYCDTSSGGGTSFIILLPLTESAAAINQGSPPGRQGKTVTTARILLVEDEAAVRAVAKRILERAGYTVITAANGHAGLTALETDRTIDLVVSDVIMPVMNGFELYNKARGMIPGIKFLFTSGYTDDHLGRMGINLSEITFISKPYSVIDLLNRVKAELAR